ncbi:MAG: redoxin domain-containing protein [Candidatus Eisenbacteria bacterium]|nr:redoxin domain-containing protein [Candidatus Eisenbacteria bacterium]
MEDFKKLNVEIVGASADSPEKNAAFAEKFGFPFPLICDIDRKVGSRYGVYEAPGKSAKRMTFVIAPDGKLAKVYRSVKAAEHPQKVLDDLRTMIGAS